MNRSESKNSSSYHISIVGAIFFDLFLATEIFLLKQIRR